MTISNTTNTTGYLTATIDGSAYTAESVALEVYSSSLTAGGPKEGILKEGIFFTFPTSIKPGSYEINGTTRVGAWYNPGQNHNSWLAEINQGKVTVISVSLEAEPSLEISFSFVAVNPANEQQRKMIAGNAKFEGAAKINNAKYKSE